MGIAVIGGLITSTGLSLFVVPTVYTLLDDFRMWLGGKLRRHGPSEEVTFSPPSPPAESPGAG
jgi:HAE1 family hydrophobic/amphiphilic exporter-1